MRDPLMRFYDACSRCYNDDLLLATQICMSRETQRTLIRQIPRSYAGFSSAALYFTALTEPIGGTLVPVIEDNDAPYGEMLVRFQREETVIPGRTRFVVKMEWLHVLDDAVPL